MTDILGLIRKNREARGWTEYQLAERSGLPQSTISSEDRLALTPAQRTLLDKWSRLPPGQQSSLLALMDAMLEK